MKKVLISVLFSLGSFALATLAFAADSGSSAAAAGGIGSVAETARTNLEAVAQLITAASYVAGMAFGVGAIIKFKAHKDNPTQIPIGTPIALLFVGAALIFIPSVYQVAGTTMFGAEGEKGGVEGTATFGEQGGGSQ